MSIKNGTLTGKIDDKGVAVRCGDRVKLLQVKPSYRETSTQDGWGKDVPLCEHIQRVVPEEKQVTLGTVKYSTEFFAFTIVFDSNLLGVGVSEAALHMLGRSKIYPDDRLTVVSK